MCALTYTAERTYYKQYDILSLNDWKIDLSLIPCTVIYIYALLYYYYYHLLWICYIMYPFRVSDVYFIYIYFPYAFLIRLYIFLHCSHFDMLCGVYGNRPANVTSLLLLTFISTSPVYYTQSNRKHNSESSHCIIVRRTHHRLVINACYIMVIIIIWRLNVKATRRSLRNVEI